MDRQGPVPVAAYASIARQMASASLHVTKRKLLVNNDLEVIKEKYIEQKYHQQTRKALTGHKIKIY